MSTVNDLLVEQVERLKEANTKLQERLKTSEATNRALRAESSKLNMDMYLLKDETKTLRDRRDQFEKMTDLIKLFKEAFKLADEGHDHDGKYKRDDD